MKYEILNTRIYTASDCDMSDYALSALGGCSDYGNPDDKGLGMFQVEFDVNVTNNNNENEKFTVIFQPEQRLNKIKNYSGFEMDKAIRFGLDADESNKLEEFTEYDDSIIAELQDIAESYAKKELGSLLEIYNKPVYDLCEYIEIFFSGSQRQFAETQGVQPAQVTQWLNKNFIIIDHNLYSHRRELKKNF